MNDIVMPKLSDTMTEGRLISWKKRVGEAVRRGDILAEVETDKANMELEAFASGVLLEIRVQAGELAQVGTVIGVIGKAEEQGAQAAQPATAAAPKAEPAATQPKAEPAPEPAAPKPEPTAAEPKAEPAVPAAPEAGTAEPVAVPPKGGPEAVAEEPDEKSGAAAAVTPGAGTQAPVEPPGEAEAVGAQGQVPAETRERAAPVVRRRARELGVDLSQVKGSGPDGRILLQDLERHEAAPAGSGKPAVPVGEAPAEEGLRPLSRLRAAVAKTVSESWSSIPHFSVTMDLLMDEAEAVRRQLKQIGLAVTVNDMVVRGVTLALQKFPQLNASFAADGVHLHGEINIGIAVGVPDGVLVPVVSGCQRLSLLEISQAGRRLGERARSGALSEQEMGGGTFSVSNMGMYGVSQFSAIIYPAQAAVLTVGAVVDAAVVRAGVPACAKLMKVTLSADHRLIDGVYAAQFLAELKGLLENPLRLLI
jgi:pyruvate dehydrogenase E2 component (dihydrolipoamide acetyltransferase)